MFIELTDRDDEDAVWINMSLIESFYAWKGGSDLVTITSTTQESTRYYVKETPKEIMAKIIAANSPIYREEP